MKKILLITILMILPTFAAYPQSINLRFNTFFYSWQRPDSLTSNGNTTKTSHLRSYQNLLFGLTKDKWSFNFLFQSEGDLVNRIGKGFNYRFYNMYLKGSDLFNVLDVKAGRQYVFAGVGKGPVDGIYFKIKAGKNKEYQLTGYGGFLTPDDYEFKKYSKPQDNFMAGAQFSYYGIKDLFLGLSYVNKHRKPVSYTTNRLDSLYNTQEVTIDIASPAQQLAGLDVNYAFMNKHNFYGRVYYDINLRKLYRAEVNARVQVTDNLRLSGEYLYREPQMSYNTIFWVFYHKQNQEIEGSVDYTFKNGLNVYGKVGEVIYDQAHSTRLQLGFNNPSYGLSFTRYFGYAGESDGVSGYYYRELAPSKLSVTVSADFSRYGLGDYSEDKVNSFSGMLGFAYRPSAQFTIDAQGQFITNRIYKFDTRVLFGISYWLFKKF